jgi:hypothetical protein
MSTTTWKYIGGMEVNRHAFITSALEEESDQFQQKFLKKKISWHTKRKIYPDVYRIQ